MFLLSCAGCQVSRLFAHWSSFQDQANLSQRMK